MDKEFLIRVNNSFKKIKTKILLNEKIRTLLYYDDAFSEDVVAPPIETVSDHVLLQPVINVDVKEPFNIKNYLTITIPEGTKTDNSMVYVVRIIVMCDKSTWNINGDVRPLLIAQEIVNDINNFKVDFSNQLIFTDVVETVTNEDVFGYSLLFTTVDGISDNNDQ